MPRFKLSRRAVLKGAGGAVVALPLLEVMMDGGRAAAQTASAIPKRYLVCVGGHSLCGGNSKVTDHVVPTNTGPGYDLKTALMPLSGVQSEVTIVSGLQIPTVHDNGGTLPAGGRSNNFHGYMTSALLSGVRSANGIVNGPSSDQVAATFLGATNTFKSLSFRVQVSNYVNSGGEGTPISWRQNADGSIQQILPQSSPQQAFQSLFGNFAGGLTASELEAQKLAQASRLSVIDRVKRRAEVLSQKLGTADRKRLALHLEEVRELEKRVAAEPPPVQGICQKPVDPGPDPTVGGGQQTASNGNITYSQNLGYSGEEQRARVFCDLIHMAMACDLTRVASLQFTMFQSFLNMHALTGQASDLHELSHGGFGNLSEPVSLSMARGIAWHMKHFAYLVDRFRTTPEGNGTMLDNVAMLYLPEGGFGYDPSSGSNTSPHSTQNMAVWVAGRAGGLKPGLHLSAPGKHPANVILTALNAVGYGKSAFGEISGEIAGLR